MLAQKLLILVASCVAASQALIGFDCGGQNLNSTTISLLSTGDCNTGTYSTNSTNTYIQLLQLSHYDKAAVMQCKVSILRTIYHCGMHSHVSAVHNGQTEYLLDIPFEKCQQLHQDGSLSIGQGAFVTGLQVNATTHRSVTLAGSISVDGECKGTQYSDPYGTWDSVVVQAVVKVTLKTAYGTVHLESGKISLRSGTVCALSDGHCIDMDDGHTFWKPMPTSSCDFSKYDVLYEGQANRLQDQDVPQHSPTIYSLITNDITFALTKTGETKICGYTLHRTEHPKLFILETKEGNVIAHQRKIPVENLDIFTYVNSKFVYVEKHIKTQMNSLYNDVISQKCILEKQVIKNALATASLQPDEFAFVIMKEPGYMAVAAGEVIHVVKCVPVEVRVRQTPQCYNELPVTVRNTSLFISPKSHIIKRFGTERECSPLLPVMYRIEDTWVKLSPRAEQVLPPTILKPSTTLNWKYLTPGPLAVSGIYTNGDLERLREHIMFPAEKAAVLNSIARGATGHKMQVEGVSMFHLLDEETFNRIVESSAARIWGAFTWFGNATAGFIGIFMLFRLGKLLIDTIIHGYALHDVYGCGIHLLAAVWDSFTNFLLHKGHKENRTRRTKRDNEEARENGGPPSAPTLGSNETTTVQPEPRVIYPDLREAAEQTEQIPSARNLLFKGGRCDVPSIFSSDS